MFSILDLFIGFGFSDFCDCFRDFFLDNNWCCDLLRLHSLRKAASYDCLADTFIDIQVAVRGLISPQLVSLLLQHVIQHLHPQEELLILFLEVLFSQDLECFFIGKWLSSEWVSVLGNLVGDWTH